MTAGGELGRLLDALGAEAIGAIGCNWFAATDLSGARSLVVFETGAVPGGGWLTALGARLAADRQPDGWAALARRPDLLAAELASAEVLVLAGWNPRRHASRARFELLQLCRSADTRWRERTMRSGMDAHPSGRGGPRSRPIAAP